MPGPDGMPYRVFVYGGIDGVPCLILYEIYENVIRGITPPSDFVAALMVFIPKDLHTENPSDDGSRKTDGVRPLCLGNCAAKITTAAVVQPLVGLSQTLVDRDQFGMIKGRQITDNILELETEGLCASICSTEGDAAFLLTDFSNAFPFLLHEWIFFVLECMNIPEFIIVFLKFLYDNATADIVYNGKQYDLRITFKRGVRQGGTESGVIFVLVLDPLLRWFKARALRPRDSLKAYADDCGLAVVSLRLSLPRILRGFHVLEIVGVSS